MKNALFSGISAAKKDSDSDDDDKKPAQQEAQAAEINLLDFDGPSQAQSTDLLGGSQPST